jgi:hypothetical protein
LLFQVTRPERAFLDGIDAEGFAVPVFPDDWAVLLCGTFVFPSVGFPLYASVRGRKGVHSNKENFKRRAAVEYLGRGDDESGEIG